jgi:DNA primase
VHLNSDCCPSQVREIPSQNPRALKRDCDFVALVSRYTHLRRSSGRQFVGLCPFHDESNPSFFVEPIKKIFFCHGCRAGGDTLDFIMLAEHCDFCCALQIVSDFCEREVARVSSQRSCERPDASEETAGFSARAAGVTHSPTRPQAEHARLVARLDATEARLLAIRAANEEAAMELATACEPRDGENHD